MNISKNENGFSLIELSLSIAIFATAIIIISTFFLNNLSPHKQELQYQALDLCKSTLEEYKTKSVQATTILEDYGEIKNYNYDTQQFKRKIVIGGKELQRIKVTIFWQEGLQERQISLTTLQSSQPFLEQNENSNTNQILRNLLTAKEELAYYKEQEKEFPAWDRRTGNLRAVSDYYSKFNTTINNPEQIAYRNPKFYNWWNEGYLLVYKEKINDKFYCITDNSGLFTIKAQGRKDKQILGDLVADSNRDKVIFLSHATQFWRESDTHEK